MNKQAENDQAAVKTAQQLQQLSKELDSATHWERTKLVARARRQHFMALLAAGFSEQQALFLVKP